jgi:UDP-N-acetylmuramate dehydrogenase
MMVAQTGRRQAALRFQEIWRERNQGGELRLGESMRRHTYSGIGGPADLFYLPRTVRQVASAVGLARSMELPWRVVGRGANLLVRDGGLRGLTVKLAENFQGARFGDRWVYSRAGATFANLGKKCVKRGWGGLEFGVGIPGSVGGAVRMNAGAYGHDTAEVVEKARYLDGNGVLRSARREELEFSYRRSSFREGEVILGALFRLRETPPDPEVLEQARSRGRIQPISQRSFGSTFKNPPGGSAWRLIEAAGLRGRRRGGVEVSMMHPNFLVNRTGKALAADVEALLEEIESEVESRFGIRLEREVRVIGEKEDGR